MKRFASLIALLMALALGTWFVFGERERRSRVAAESERAPSAEAQPSSALVDAPAVAQPAATTEAASTREAVTTMGEKGPQERRSDNSISGRVRDESGAGVGEFTIDAQRTDRWSKWSQHGESISRSFRDSSGVFALQGFAPGTWRLTATAKGYSDSTSLTITVPCTTPLELTVSRPAALRGVVLDAHGAHVVGATLSIEEGLPPSESAAGESDERGAFAIEDLHAGPVTLNARANGWAPSEPLEVELAPGQVMDDLVLRLRRGGTIAGDVLDPGGRPVTEQAVFIEGPDHRRTGVTKTDAKGHFEFTDVPAGTYEVQSSASGGLRLHEQIALGEGEQRLVRLAALGNTFVQVHGHVTIGGQASGGITIHAAGPSVSSGSSVECDTEGAYQLTVPAGGQYGVFLQRYNGDSFSWMKTIEVPQVAQFALDIAVPAARIGGRVTSRAGAPLGDISIHANGEGEEREFVGAHTVTDDYGRYEILVAAGLVTVIAGGNDSSADESSTSWPEAHVTGLSVAADQKLEGVDFVLSEGGTLAGRVQRSDGGSLSGIVLFNEQGTKRAALGGADEDGRFRLRGMEPGAMLVGAAGEDSTTARLVPVTITAGQTTEIELALVHAVRGHVLVNDAAGSPTACVIALLDGDGHACAVNPGKKVGEAWLGLLRAGRYTLRAEHDGKHAERVLDVRGDEKTLELALTLE